MKENDHLKSTVLYHKNNNPENEMIFPEGVSSYGATAFLIRSLEKIKKNTGSEIFKNLIDKYIEEYLLHIKDNTHEHIITGSIETSVEEPSFILYAKTAYNKVLKEEECLNRLLDTLERNNIEKYD